MMPALETCSPAVAITVEPNKAAQVLSRLFSGGSAHVSALHAVQGAQPSAGTVCSNRFVGQFQHASESSYFRSDSLLFPLSPSRGNSSPSFSSLVNVERMNILKEMKSVQPDGC